MTPATRLLIGACSLLFLAAAAPASVQPAEPLRVLFIGNSYTYTNNLPAIVSAFSRALPNTRPIDTGMVATGGATLRSAWTDGKALAAIRSGRWDYVVLQEQSSLGSLFVNGRIAINDPAKYFYEYARRFDAAIHEAGARTAFFLTWAPQDEPDEIQPLTEAYATIAAERHAVLAPVGTAWAVVRSRHPEIELFDPAPYDGMHPSPAGSYLSAAVIYAALTGQSAAGAAPRITGPASIDGVVDGTKLVTLASLDRATAAALQAAAWTTVNDGRTQRGTPAASTYRRPLLPVLSPPSPMSSAAIVGRWNGALALYYRSSATIEITLSQSGGQLQGHLTLTPERFTGAETFTMSAIDVSGDILSFTVPNKRYEQGVVTYRAVLTPRGLEGTAQYGDEARSAFAIGSWTASR